MLSAMRPNFLLLLTIVATAAAAAQLKQVSEPRKAIAVVTGTNTNVRGNITFTQIGKRVVVTGRVTGLSPGMHGFHVHEKGDLSNGCASTGSHFNPESKPHGSPSDKDRHLGDLGNIMADAQGVAVINITDDQISLMVNKRNILGRGLVIHQDPDDLGRGGENDSLTTGHAGVRVGCGVIGIL